MVGVGLTKGLSEKSLSSSLISIHILYNQALVGGVSDSSDPATRIVNLSLHGVSTRAGVAVARADLANHQYSSTHEYS